MNLHQKIIEIKKNIKGFNKDSKAGNGSYVGYEYVSGSQILRAIKEKMDELGVLLIPSVDYDTMKWEKHNYTTAKGANKTDFIVTMKMNYTWVNAEDPQDKISVPWVCMGQQTDDISKAVGTAMTYNERYFLLKFLGLPTDEDDADAKPLNTNVSSLNTENKWTNPKLTDAQVKRLYAIAYKKGIAADKVKEQVLKKFNKEIKDLTKAEYDKVCEGYENIKVS